MTVNPIGSEPTINMDDVADLVVKAGFAAYVEQTGGGCATIYASREWEDRAITRMGVPDTARFPKAIDADGHHEVAAGPGWFDGPGFTDPRGSANDFYVGADDDGEGEYAGCEGLDEAAIAELIIGRLRAAKCCICGGQVGNPARYGDVCEGCTDAAVADAIADGSLESAPESTVRFEDSVKGAQWS